MSALVAGNMVGAGVFLLPSSLAAYGSISILGWLVTTIGAIFLALVFSSLSRKMSAQGGAYAYCRHAFGDLVGFVVVYNYWIGMWIGSASVVVALTGYLAFFIPELPTNNLTNLLVSIGIVWSLTSINILGVRAAGVMQLLTTILKLLPLIALCLYGVFFVEFNNLQDFNVSGLSNTKAIVGAAALTLWSFIGLESATVPSDQIKEPSKIIPKATIFGTVTTSLVYVISTFVIFGTVSNGQLMGSSAPYALSAAHIFGSFGGLIIAGSAILACYGSLNGWILLQGQLPLAAAKDGLFPKVFSKVNSKGTPRNGLVISSLLISILLLIGQDMDFIMQFNMIISMAVFSTLIVYVITVCAEIKMIWSKSGVTYKLLKSMIIPAIAFLYSCWMIYGLENKEILYGFVLFLTSFPIYYFFVYKKSSKSL